MKKNTPIIVLIAIACILVGCAIAMTALAIADFDLAKLSVDTQLTNTYPITEDITSFDIRTMSSDIVFAPSPDGTMFVECLETDKHVHDVSVVGETLTIRENNLRKWYEHIGIFYYDAKVTVYIPNDTEEKIFNHLSLNTSSGDIFVEDPSYRVTNSELHTSSGDILYQAYTIKTLTVGTSSGDVEVNTHPKGIVEIRTVSGDVTLADMSGSNISVSTSSGNITADFVNALTLNLSSTSGDMYLHSLVSGSLTTDSSSGDLEIDHAKIETVTQLHTISGDIQFNEFDSETIGITTSSGNIKGHLLTPKNFITRTSSGTVNVPPSEPLAGNCEIQTSSGDIRIDILS